MGSSALLLLKLALLAAYTAPPAAAAPTAECERKCGNVDIPYPFGMTKDCCFKHPDFEITCNSSSGHPIPYLARNETYQILRISGDTSEIHVSMPVVHVCYDPKIDDNQTLSSFDSGRFWVPSKFGISNKKNKFNVLGCNSYGILYDRKGKRVHGCLTSCSDQRSVTNYNGSCSSDGCCQNEFEQALTNYSITIAFYDSSDGCGFAFLAQNGSFSFSSDNDLKKLNRSTVVLDWAVDDTTSCGGACKGDKTNLLALELQR